MIKQPKVLPPPDERPYHLPISAKWLSGEGAGSWFVFEALEKLLHYKITRFSPIGVIECEGVFSANKKIDMEKDYSVSYPSHCLKVSLVQGEERILFRLIDK